MDKVFVDAAAWIAIFVPKDSLHAAAISLYADMRRVKTNFVTTEFVLLEVADAFASARNRNETVEFIERLRADPLLEIIPASQSLWSDGWSLYKQRPDKDWGLTDCISFVTMRRESMARAFTSDQHFAQAGFVKLLQN